MPCYSYPASVLFCLELEGERVFSFFADLSLPLSPSLVSLASPRRIQCPQESRFKLSSRAKK
jgi:hypothetical protein